MNPSSRPVAARARRMLAAALLAALAVSTAVSGSVAAADLLGTVARTTSSLLKLVPVLVPGTPTASSTVTRIDGAKGGVAKCGRFSVVVPPGAWRGEADVVIRVPDGSRLACDLDISPQSLNGFSRPVQLRMDAVGAITSGGLVIGWWDPEQKRWVRVPGSVQDLLTLQLSAPLWHFSKYGGFDGKAGW